MTAEHLTTILQSIARTEGPDLSLARFCARAGISNQTVYRHISGGWPELRNRAGLHPCPRRRADKHHSDADLLLPVLRFYRGHSRMPRWDEIDRSFPASRVTYARRFGGIKAVQRAAVAFVKASAPDRAAADSP